VRFVPGFCYFVRAGVLLLCQGVQDARISETAADIIRRRVMESILSCGLFVVAAVVIDCHRVTSDDKQQNGRHIRNYYVNFFKEFGAFHDPVYTKRQFEENVYTSIDQMIIPCLNVKTLIKQQQSFDRYKIKC
jgi:hypothetical protein